MSNNTIEEVWQAFADKVHTVNIDEAPIENKVVISLGMVILGLLYCLIGRSLLRFVVFGIGAMVAGGTAYAMSLEGLELEYTHVVQLYSASIWLMAVGLVGGAACVGLLRIALVVLGGLAGVRVGVLLNEANVVESAHVAIAISVAMVLALSLVAYQALSLLTIILTATLGSLLLTLGADVLLETGFTAFLLTLDEPTPQIWSMVAATILFGTGSVLLQLRTILRSSTSSAKKNN